MTVIEMSITFGAQCDFPDVRLREEVPVEDHLVENFFFWLVGIR